MRRFIELDGKCYMTSSKDWEPKVQIPSTVNFNLDGTLDATFGPATVYIFTGTIIVPVTPPSTPPASGKTWGTVSDLKNSLAKRQILTLIDHYAETNVTYQVVSNGYVQKSLSPVWDGSSNVLQFIVQLVGRRVTA